MTREELAWAAGLFEGEGTIGIRKHRGYLCNSPYISVRMTDRDVLRKLHRIMGGRINGPYQHKSRNPNWSEFWIWCVSGGDAVTLLLAMIPYLGARRESRAWEVINGMTPRQHGRPKVRLVGWGNPFWYAACRGKDGRIRDRSTRQTNKHKAMRIAAVWMEES